jgi:hypothetical protein
MVLALLLLELRNLLHKGSTILTVKVGIFQLGEAEKAIGIINDPPEFLVESKPKITL